MTQEQTLKKRKLILTFGVFSMLFAGVIYSWSILKVPLGSELNIDSSSLALSYTLTMCFFCLGGLLGSVLNKRFSTPALTIASGIIAGLGFILTGLVVGSEYMLYLTYSLMAGGGIGIVYNVVISSVNSWFPDKKGLCSGCLMMGFGASTLILGNLCNMLFGTPSVGWRTTYLILGIALALALAVSGLFIRRPNADDALPSSALAKRAGEDFEIKDLTPREMITRPSFILAFILLVSLTAVGSSVISFARDLAISVGANGSLAATLVGVLSVCNGLGRIITGRLFDIVGRKRTMLLANIITLIASATILLAVYLTSLPIAIIGLCLTGLSYGSSPTVSSAFTSSFYGTKHFATNFSIMNCNLILASFVATGCSWLMKMDGGFTLPFIFLLALSVVSLILNLSIKKP